MKKQLQTFFVSLLTPGLGYLQTGDVVSFYKIAALFFGVTAVGAITRLFTSFWGLLSIIVALTAIYILATVDATLKNKSENLKLHASGILKLFFTITFFLITGLSFANRRTILGFDILSMEVSVMQPAVYQNEKFLIDTWAYKNSLPERGDIIVHTFGGQQGLYLNRIVAIENDKIEIKNSIVFLNGHKVNEPYVLPANITKAQSKNMKARVIPKGNYFVMGDNRDASFGDSRFSGTITPNNILGKTTDIVYSQNKGRIGKSLQ